MTSNGGWRAALLGAAAVALGCPPGGPGPESTVPDRPGALDRFRPDAWYLPDDELLGFVGIPAGPFVMGSDGAVDPAAFENERWSAGAARGALSLPLYYIGRSEVTVAQFAAFAAATGARVSDDALAGAPDYPVASVSWPDALAYCRWLDAMLRASEETPAELRARLDDGWQVTLPSEAEWEKAARGTDGRRYPWGDDPRPDAANYDSPGTRPVGSTGCPDCPYGLTDLAGNVWELTRSRYQPYPFTDDPGDDLSTDALFVMRGGSYLDRADLVRTTVRGGADPGVRRPFIGFRIVITRF